MTLEHFVKIIGIRLKLS